MAKPVIRFTRFYAITCRPGDQEILVWFKQRLEQREKGVTMLAVWFPIVQRSTDVKTDVLLPISCWRKKIHRYVTNHRTSDGELLERCTAKQNATAG